MDFEDRRTLILAFLPNDFRLELPSLDIEKKGYYVSILYYVILPFESQEAVFFCFGQASASI
jgi:hypothetical protein